MSFTFYTKNYEYSLNSSANCEITHFRKYKNDGSYHYVWWRFSLWIQDMNHETSLCPYCDAPTEERGYGDEGWTFCSEDCGCLEGADNKSMTYREMLEEGMV